MKPIDELHVYNVGQGCPIKPDPKKKTSSWGNSHKNKKNHLKNQYYLKLTFMLYFSYE